VDGRVIGTWDYEEEERPVVKLHLVAQVEPDVLARVRHSAAEMGKFLSGNAPLICECPTMVPLTQRTAGSFMSPLKGQTSEA
jgi:hypothetical protein